MSCSAVFCQSRTTTGGVKNPELSFHTPDLDGAVLVDDRDSPEPCGSRDTPSRPKPSQHAFSTPFTLQGQLKRSGYTQNNNAEVTTPVGKGVKKSRKNDEILPEDPSRRAGESAAKSYEDIVLTIKMEDEDTSSCSDTLTHGDVRPSQGLQQVPANASSCCCCLAAPGAARLRCASREPADAAPYRHMLRDCFQLTFPEDMQASLQICTQCMERLKDAVKFKQRALECHRILTEAHIAEHITVKKEEQAENDPQEAMMSVFTHVTGTPSFLTQLKQSLQGYTLEPTDTNIPDDTNTSADAWSHTKLFTSYNDNTDLYIQTTDIFNCGCRNRCSQQFPKDNLTAFRTECKKIDIQCASDNNHLDIFVLGALTCLNRTLKTSNLTKSHIVLKFKGLEVCQTFFTYVHNIDIERYEKLVKRILIIDKDLTDTDKIALNFIKRYSVENSLILPQLSHSQEDLHMLPQNITNYMIYLKYVEAISTSGNPFVDKFVWDNIWERWCSNIVYELPKDNCEYCKENARILAKIDRFNCESRSAIVQRCLNHWQHIIDERKHYDIPEIIDSNVHCSIQITLAGEDIAILAIASESLDKLALYVLPSELATTYEIPSFLEHFLTNIAPSGQLVCYSTRALHSLNILHYIAWRKNLRISFLPKGHDQPRTADYCLGHIKDVLRTKTIEHFNDIVRIATETFGPKAVIIPVADENGFPKISMYNWREFFSSNNPLPANHLQKYNHFEGDSSGVLKCKVRFSESWDTWSVFSGDVSMCMPETRPTLVSGSQMDDIKEENADPLSLDEEHIKTELIEFDSE